MCFRSHGGSGGRSDSVPSRETETQTDGAARQQPGGGAAGPEDRQGESGTGECAARRVGHTDVVMVTVRAFAAFRVCSSSFVNLLAFSFSFL